MKINEHPNCNVLSRVVAANIPFSIAVGQYIGVDDGELGYAVLYGGMREPLMVMHKFTICDVIAKLSKEPSSGFPMYFDVLESNGEIEICSGGYGGMRRGDAIIDGGFSLTLAEASILLTLLQEVISNVNCQA